MMRFIFYWHAQSCVRDLPWMWYYDTEQHRRNTEYPSTVKQKVKKTMFIVLSGPTDSRKRTHKAAPWK